MFRCTISSSDDDVHVFAHPFVTAGRQGALGSGLDARRRLDSGVRRLEVEGSLVVDVADDDGSTERTAPVSAVTPPLDDTFGAALAHGLDPATERKVLLGVLAARGPAANPNKLKAAAKKLRAVTRILAKHDVVSGPLFARLTVLAADCAAGVAPPSEPAFETPADLGAADELLAAAPRAGFLAKPTARLVSALIQLRFAERLGNATKTAAAKKRVVAAAAALPTGAAGDWFRASVATL